MQAQVNILKQKLHQKKTKHMNELELLESESFERIK